MNRLALIVMDGIGVSEKTFGNAVAAARTPTLDALMKEGLSATLKAHGTAVGLPSDDDMGNSEVGHNALGCGQVYSQGAKLVNESIESGRMFTSRAWQELVNNCADNGSFHFIGLLSDGNVHSNIAHLKAMLTQTKAEGVKRARVHILLDGRDVPATSAVEYIGDLESHLAGLNSGGFDGRIASGGGRMKITMDRYNADWGMVKRGWDTHVLGRGRTFASATEAVETLRAENAGIIDQDLPPFVIAENGEPVGRIQDGDSVALFNFRGDRAIEISLAFDNDDFDAFDREIYPAVTYAGMLQYDGDLNIPQRFLVSPPDIKNTLTELLIQHGVKEYAVSETQKYGHVTYFWNGNRNGKFSEKLEEYKEIPSDKVSFDERPWMKAAEVTDAVIEAINDGSYSFIRANFPNGDMVGHTGNFNAAVIAVETVDLCLARIAKAAREKGVTLIITADHGNSDEMIEKSKSGKESPKTAHTLNPVPFIIIGAEGYKIKDGAFGLSNVAATVAELLGIAAPEEWDEALIERR
ncbi:MAG: 2,3-bisphosphoglycerate-independent phosphoglycerate mutase [Clostridiales bacterium]|jgi:2,3-bisphosphoglycerate-independent phosphoglycerate mutase|nr:2,3-bisphosphoglycerate-independent phosphoglycerate mutase [Clostridiales bacterium]